MVGAQALNVILWLRVRVRVRVTVWHWPKHGVVLPKSLPYTRILAFCTQLSFVSAIVNGQVRCSTVDRRGGVSASLPRSVRSVHGAAWVHEGTLGWRSHKDRAQLAWHQSRKWPTRPEP